MHRRQFFKNTLALAAAAALPAPFHLIGRQSSVASRQSSVASRKPSVVSPILGHGDFRYRVDLGWAAQNDRARYPVNDCHEMAMDRRGRIFMTTNDTRNNILIFNKDGRILDGWGTDYPGAHGLTLHDEGGEEMLYIADYERHEVVKTTLDGRVARTFPYPADSGRYGAKAEFRPTETAIGPNGDVFIADGYGLDYVVHYDAEGRLKNMFGGKNTDQPGFLNNAHGIALDTRDPAVPTLLVTSRAENCVKRFSLTGAFIGAIPLRGAFVCRPVVRGENVFFAVLIAHLPWDSQSGFVLILDKNNRVVSCPGGSTPRYDAVGVCESFHQTVKAFKHPHDVLPDADGNLYVAQWNAGQVYPARLERV